MSHDQDETGTRAPSFAIERLAPSHHQTAHFQSGIAELDTYIRSTRSRDEADRTAAAYVLVDKAEGANDRRVIGYFTLNSFAFPQEQGRRRDRDRHLGAYNPVPAILIGRLALGTSSQGQGLSSVLLFQALCRSLILSVEVGAAVVVVHASDANVARFYEHQGFTRFRDEPHHLYYPLNTFARAVPPSRRIEGV